MTTPAKFALSGEESARLHDWAHNPANSQRSRRRARIVLLAAQGATAASIARTVGVRTETAALWISRFSLHRMDGLTKEAPRPRGSRSSDDSVRERILRTTHEVAPPDPRGWTTRTLARHLGVSHMRVHRVWKAHGVGESPPAPPAATPGAGFVPFVDIAGLFLEPPHRTVVFAVGVKWDSSISSVPLLSPVPHAGHSGAFWTRQRQTGPDELLKAIEGAPTGTPTRRFPGHSSSDLLIFLRRLEEQTPPSVQLHIVVESLGPSSGRSLRHWAERKLRFRVTEVMPGGTLVGQCRAFLQPWQTTRLHRGSFAHATRAADVIRGRVGTSPTRAFFWSPTGEPFERSHSYALSTGQGIRPPVEPWTRPPESESTRTGPTLPAGMRRGESPSSSSPSRD